MAGFTGTDCDLLEKEFSAQTNEAHYSSGIPLLVVFCVCVILVATSVAYYYRRKLSQLKEMLYVEYSNYNNSEPRHFDNPVYSSMPSNSASKLLNNANANNSLKNTNLIKSKMHFDDFDQKSPELGNHYETTNHGNIYVELDDDKASKANNFYHTIDEIDTSYKGGKVSPSATPVATPVATSTATNGSSKCIVVPSYPPFTSLLFFFSFVFCSPAVDVKEFAQLC